MREIMESKRKALKELKLISPDHLYKKAIKVPEQIKDDIIVQFCGPYVTDKIPVYTCPFG